MKVFHIESGLGNQMLDYADLLAARYSNPDEEFYIETILYELGEKQDGISMWNGYELETIFGIHENNIKERFSPPEWADIIRLILQSEFWNDGWTYSDAICSALEKYGMKMINRHQRPHTGRKVSSAEISRVKYFFKNRYYRLFPKKTETAAAIPEKLFFTSHTDDYNGHYLSFMYKGNKIEAIEDPIRRSFVFPAYDEKNKAFSDVLKHSNAVAIHARRGDFLGHNAYCYKYGYFKRAVSLVKSKVKNPLFVFFCDPGSIAWCRENSGIFALDFKKDAVKFVDWNSGTNSFRDMQLMADCKHNIITNSSFGWWGAYLNGNPDKITVSPDAKINTTHWI